MRQIEDLLQFVLPYAPGCAEPTAVQHLIMAATTFCERTRCWRHVDTFTTNDDCHQIMAVPGQALLHEIQWAKFNEKDLEPVVPKSDNYHTNTDDTYSEPRYITQVNPTCISIEPHAEGELTVSMYLKPAHTADMLPDFMISHYGYDLAHGALSTLLLIPNQPFTNPQMAIAFDVKFNQALDKNFDLNLRGQQRARKRTRGSYL